MVILRMEGFDMANRLRFDAHGKTVRAPRHRIIIGHRPAIRTRHQSHPVRPQHMQLPRQRAHPRHRFDIGIARQQKMPVNRLKQLRAPLHTIGAADQVQYRVRLIAPLRILQNQRQRRRRLGNQLDRAKANRVALKPRPRQAHRIARAPRHPA